MCDQIYVICINAGAYHLLGNISQMIVYLKQKLPRKGIGLFLFAPPCIFQTNNLSLLIQPEILENIGKRRFCVNARHK